MINRLKIVGLCALFVVSMWGAQSASAQHTLSLTGGYGGSYARFYPKQEGRIVWTKPTAGLSWRYYSGWLYVGSFGLDLEWMQSGYSFAPLASTTEDKSQLKYYSRSYNTVMLPVIWQPYVYVAKNHIRIFVDLGATFSYNFASTYTNQIAKDELKPDASGSYEFKTVRDNSFSYGLVGGAGVAFIIKRFEVSVGARYYFGLSDILKNRTKYYDNGLDGSENPFAFTPLRSPVDNIMFRVSVGYRFSPSFDAWRPRAKHSRNVEKFNYTGAEKKK